MLNIERVFSQAKQVNHIRPRSILIFFLQLGDYSSLPRRHQTCNAPKVTNEAGGTMEEQQQHSAIAIIVADPPTTGNGMTENGDGGTSAKNPSGSSPVCIWLRRKIYAIWLLLVTRDINPLKTGSLALSLISFFVDNHLSHEDNTYLEVALWCGVIAFLVAPWSVPNVNAPRLAKTRQATAMLALIVGVLIAVVTAVDLKKYRWLVVSFFAIFFLFRLCGGGGRGGGGWGGGGGGGS